jgi:hypothetical protein
MLEDATSWTASLAGRGAMMVADVDVDEFAELLAASRESSRLQTRLFDSSSSASCARFRLTVWRFSAAARRRSFSSSKCFRSTITTPVPQRRGFRTVRPRRCHNTQADAGSWY